MLTALLKVFFNQPKGFCVKTFGMRNKLSANPRNERVIVCRSVTEETRDPGNVDAGFHRHHRKRERTAEFCSCFLRNPHQHIRTGRKHCPGHKKRRFSGRAFRTVCGMTGHGQTVAAARHRHDDADVGPRPGICFGNLAAGQPFLVKRVSAAHEQNVTA